MDVYVQLTSQQLTWAASQHKFKEYTRKLNRLPPNTVSFLENFCKDPFAPHTLFVRKIVFIRNIWKEVRIAAIILGTMTTMLLFILVWQIHMNVCMLYNC